MNKGFKSNMIIVILIIATIGVIGLGIKKDKIARAKDLEEAKAYETKNTVAIKNEQKNDKKKDAEENKDTLNIYSKLNSGKDIKVLIVGDSIGKSIEKSNDAAAWDIKLKKLLEDKYKSECTIENISEEYATSYKGYSDIMKNDIKDYDLAIVCFGASDERAKDKDENQFSSTYEAVIRQLKKKNPNGEIITVLENIMKNKNFVDIIKEVSNNYSLDMVDGIAAYDNSGVDKNQLFADRDKLHPNDKGYELYANAIYKTIEKNVEAKKTVNKELKNAINADSESFDKFNFVTKFDSNNGFEIKDDAVVSTKDGSEIGFKTSASKVGISYLDMKDGGLIKIYVNDKFIKDIDTSSKRDIKKAKLIADNLKGENTIKIRSNRKAVKIFGIITN